MQESNKKLCFYIEFILLLVIAAPIMAFLTLSANNTSAVSSSPSPDITAGDDTIIDNVSVIVPVSCSLSGTGMTTHTTNINPGQYVADIGITTLKALCNDNNGFAIYAAGYTGETIGDASSNKLVGTNTNQTIITGTNTSGNTSNWAMKLATNSSATYPIILAGSTSDTERQTGDPDFSTYVSVPNEYKKVAYRTSATDIGSSAIGATLTTTYAAFVTSTQPADTYAGKVIYTLVHPASANAPVVSCNPNATTITEAKCMQDFVGNSTSIANSMTLEQQYTLKDKRDGKEYTIAKYQTKYYDEYSNGAKVASLGEEKTGFNVWMTKNLDLDLDGSVTYTNEDTDIGWNTASNQYDTAAWSPIRSTYATTASHTHEWCVGGTWNTEDDYCEANNSPESYDPGELYVDYTGFIAQSTIARNYILSCGSGVCDETLYNQLSSEWKTFVNSCNGSFDGCNLEYAPQITSSTGALQQHLGNYYNWAASIATNDSSTKTPNTETVEQSICPAGWTLPRPGQYKDSFYSLWNQYALSNISFEDLNYNGQYDTGEIALWVNPLYLNISGYYEGELKGIEDMGSYWTPVASYDDSAWGAFFLMNDDAYPSDTRNRSVGSSVRCVLRPVTNITSRDVQGK